MVQGSSISSKMLEDCMREVPECSPAYQTLGCLKQMGSGLLLRLGGSVQTPVLPVSVLWLLVPVS